ncbi:ATP-binding cassette domain-containing protein [Thermanaerosceptrum fracticalcis]|uniref:ATP-binding cassette domain-containing protein n=1 Tax=Thermanaerosceptrum fracticalcis TaxID=1712410 RepID=A0A7G6E3M8_THEFR|nr:ATP-binding cassette domain-containing protein [Thermanaerosceptrum fracticalcis]QNB46682.1 ATP-binding cassette domain-containing protein [Thermanaerosceptrum fracticalcis]
MPVLEIINCTKKFGNFTAVDAVKLKVEAGDFLGLLGPNGAGKTTLIRMVCGLLKPTGGEIRLFGQIFSRDLYSIKSKIGLIPQHNNLEGELTAWENLEFHGRLFHIPGEERDRKIREVLAFTGLENFKPASRKFFRRHEKEAASGQGPHAPAGTVGP